MISTSRARTAQSDARFRAVLDEHLDLVWRVLRRAGLAQADAEDAAQDVFWVFAQRLDAVARHAERSFLLSTALRVAADRRRLKWNRSVTESLELDDRASEGPLPEEALDLARARALLDQTLATLPATERSVFILTELEGMTRPEVAKMLDIPEGTVASRLQRARETFHAALRRFRLRGERRR